ncbi:hypothetical protein [Ancylobacter sp. FA202]|uniref:hypothetical protein n=1 Tax=Ancylobacter sp. FA202 TaxID=1111106 RepID=UPI000379DD2A|nr:hypothetical protein [Ancylobacter sp. FA202]
MSSDSTFRASFDKPTGLLIIDGPGFSGIATPEQWEANERFIRQARHRARLDAYEGKWPDGFLKQIADL